MKTINILAGNNEPGKIQRAIDKLGKEGGRIHLRRGRHDSLPLTLRSNIHLHIEMGAELIISDDFSHYKTVKTRWEGTECYALQAQIFAENCEDISITGEGLIDGQGGKWWESYRNLRQGQISVEVLKVQNKLLPLNARITGGSGGGGRETGFLRPSLVQFKNCKKVHIEGITLKDSPFWNTHILYCQDVHIENVSFINPENAPNTDGLDIDSSTQVLVDNCLFNVGDDCLCLKSGMDDDGIRVGRTTSHVVIRNCSMEKGHGGIVLGSETSGGIKDITVESCRMNGTDRGIRVKTRRGRGGIIENILLRDITMDHVSAPIVMNMFYRCGADESNLDQLKSMEIPDVLSPDSIPVIKNIHIKDIKAREVKSSSAFFFGLPESPIEGICIDGFEITAAPDETWIAPAMDFFDTRPDSPAILCRNVNDIQCNSVVINGSSEKTIREFSPEVEV